jgi:DNA processing protein
MALGIDTLAHNAALNANGKTVAVIGSGLDKKSIYPSSNRYLAEKIIDAGGMVFSEFALGALPMKHHFPQRNRTIAGICLATLVVEAGEKSGALITARCALEQNREVFAVPGSIFSATSIGTNNLIRLGAKVATDANDIIEALDLAQATEYIDNKKILPESAEEKLIIEHLNREPMYIEELIKLTKLDASVINSTLTIMEMKGMIKNLGGAQYAAFR